MFYQIFKSGSSKNFFKCPQFTKVRTYIPFLNVMKIELTRIDSLNIYIILFSIINCKYINQWSSVDCVVGINIIMLLIHDKDFFLLERFRNLPIQILVRIRHHFLRSEWRIFVLHMICHKWATDTDRDTRKLQTVIALLYFYLHYRCFLQSNFT